MRICSMSRLLTWWLFQVLLVTNTRSSYIIYAENRSPLLMVICDQTVGTEDESWSVKTGKSHTENIDEGASNIKFTCRPKGSLIPFFNFQWSTMTKSHCVKFYTLLIPLYANITCPTKSPTSASSPAGSLSPSIMPTLLPTQSSGMIEISTNIATSSTPTTELSIAITSTAVAQSTLFDSSNTSQDEQQQRNTDTRSNMSLLLLIALISVAIGGLCCFSIAVAYCFFMKKPSPRRNVTSIQQEIENGGQRHTAPEATPMEPKVTLEDGASDDMAVRMTIGETEEGAGQAVQTGQDDSHESQVLAQQDQRTDTDPSKQQGDGQLSELLKNVDLNGVLEGDLIDDIDQVNVTQGQ